MEIKVVASTKDGYCMPIEDVKMFSGRSAGICYLPEDYDTLCNEDPEKTMGRAENNLESMHHSVYGHVTYNFVLINIPKILAMVLNNEKAYTTSEKSGRYTRMKTSDEERELYDKWLEIFIDKISKKYPKISEKNRKKLAMENARYLISVFTPGTTMEYTCSIQQWNYILDWARDFIENANDNDLFSHKLKKVLKEFLKNQPDVVIEGLNSGMKDRHFSLFARTKKKKKEYFGWTYCTNYKASFTQLAQAHRHRTLSYEITIPKKRQFYVPPIIKGTDYEEEWLEDIQSLWEYFPQGMLVDVNERGTAENFVLKCTERCCGYAELGTMRQTKKTMAKYLAAVKNSDPDVYAYLEPYSHGARCTFPGWKCKEPCVFGGKDAMDRLI